MFTCNSSVFVADNETQKSFNGSKLFSLKQYPSTKQTTVLFEAQPRSKRDYHKYPPFTEEKSHNILAGEIYSPKFEDDNFLSKLEIISPYFESFQKLCSKLPELREMKPHAKLSDELKHYLLMTVCFFPKATYKGILSDLENSLELNVNESELKLFLLTEVGFTLGVLDEGGDEHNLADAAKGLKESSVGTLERKSKL